MLNLRPIFDDAIHAFSKYGSYLSVPSLPTTVFLMQCDVINHYHHALTHYLPLTLKESFLQNSSIGSPYEKWAKFTNEDFDEFSFIVVNLIRYTSRLINETEAEGLMAADEFEECKSRSSCYISPIVELRNPDTKVGIQIHSDQSISLTPFRTNPDYEGRIVTTSAVGGPTEHVLITADESGEEVRRIISEKESAELCRTLRPTIINIRDRSILKNLEQKGLAEIDSLIPLNRQFGDLCNAYNSKHEAGTKFEKLHASWCI